MKKVERNEYGKKVNANHKAFAFYLHNCPEEPVSEFVNTLRDCEFNEKWRRVLEPEEEYYHPDHLGSSSWITDQYGTPVQHIQYLPFGETWADQRSANWNAPYTFSGKEKDWETSYHYYGARYYDSEISIWLGPDPLRDKYPGWSPYVYCMNNPIILFDPNGKEVIITGEDASSAFTSLQKGTNLALSMDENGKISAEGNIMNDNDQQLYDAINSENITVNIEASIGYSSGHYYGTTYDAETNTAISDNRVNITGLSSLEKDGAAGSGMMHEVTEGYQMGLIAIKNKANISAAARTSTATTMSGSYGSITYFNSTPVNSHDYSLYQLGHSMATRAPNEMSSKQALEYKSPQMKYFSFPHISKLQYR